MEIRYILPTDDRYEISNVYEKSWKYAYKDIIPQSYLDSIPVGRWADCIGKAGMNNLVVIENGMIIGTASFCRSRFKRYESYGEIVSIYFLPDHMGKGYGRLLLERVIEELRKSGYKDILLWVLEDNHKARRFYEKSGFSCCNEKKEENIGGKKLKEVMYVSHIR